MERMSIDTLWPYTDMRLWHEAKRTYWLPVRPHLMLSEIPGIPHTYTYVAK